MALRVGNRRNATHWEASGSSSGKVLGSSKVVDGESCQALLMVARCLVGLRHKNAQLRNAGDTATQEATNSSKQQDVNVAHVPQAACASHPPQTGGGTPSLKAPLPQTRRELVLPMF